MSVSHEIKSQLARLLATEDLIVEHRKVETAFFNVHDRVLTLPMWRRATENVYDMLISHEVGHALYTPDENWKEEYDIPHQFVNVVEDVRVEKKMKRRYPGLSKTFFRGYEELASEDFFCIANEDISSMNLADKINLYFKIGSFVKIPFSSKEMEIVSVVEKCDTFKDALEAASILHKFCKDEMDNSESESEDKNKEELESEKGESVDSDNSNKQSSKVTGEDGVEEDGKGVNDEEEESNESVDFSGGKENQEIKVDTMDTLDEKLQNMADMTGEENVYIEYPKFDINKIIVDNKEIHDTCQECWSLQDENPFLKASDEEFQEFKKSCSKEVNYLVKEFECKKSATAYARASVSSTGVLDCSKLHTYKYNEDLFKKITTIPDGKNHGLVFLLDWSGSMQGVIKDTLKQLFQLLFFCQKVNIPFDVYAFTNSYPNKKLISFDEDHLRIFPHERRENVIQLSEDFSLMHLFTSGVSNKILESQMKNIWRCVWNFTRWGFEIPGGMGLSGTPLNEAFISLTEIIPAFQKRHSLEKVNCVVLTDGEAPDLRYFKEFKFRWDAKPSLRTGCTDNHTHLRDRVTGKTYKFNYGSTSWFYVLTRSLRDRMPDVNFIGFRIIPPREVSNFISVYDYQNREKLNSEWKKNRCFAIKDCGYQKYFGIASSSMSNEVEFEVGSDATKTQIKNAFIKSLKAKKTSKKILNEFVELIV